MRSGHFRGAAPFKATPPHPAREPINPQEVNDISYSQKAVDKWQSQNVRRVTIAFMRKTDADILARLDSVPNKTDYIRKLIRADIDAQSNVDTK